MNPFPFDRTTCACAECSAHCARQPGVLAPGDAEAIAALLGITPDALDASLVASPGALAVNLTSGTLFRIGGITPRRGADGRCVFLLADGRCSVHAASPAGCRFFDSHQSDEEGQRRSVAVNRAILDDEAYQAHRRRLEARDGISRDRLLGRTFRVQPAGPVMRVLAFEDDRVRLLSDGGRRGWVPDYLFFAALHDGLIEECAEAPTSL